MKKNKRSVAVIGSGFGGLAIAIRLQAAGFQVKIFEKQAKVGGHAYQLKKDGYTFDMGPSLITIPEIIEEVFKAADAKMSDYLDLIPLDPYYRIYFADKSLLDYNGNSEEMKSQLSQFNPADAEGYDRFIKYSGRLYDLVITQRLGSKPFQSMRDFFAAAPDIISTGSMFSCYNRVKKYFRDERSRFTFSFHPLFIGGDPFNAPALYLMIPYLEKVGGVWFTKGGMYSVVQAFEKLFLELGGEIKTSSEVKEIVVDGRQVKGITTQDGFEPFDLVVSNAHYAHTYKDLLKNAGLKRNSAKKVASKKYSMSCYLAYIGTKKQFPMLKHHTLILSPRYKELVKDIFDKKVLADDFSMYLHVPTRTDPDMAPEGCESMYVLIPTPNLAADIDWNVEKDRFTQKVLRFLEEDFGMEGLKDSIEVLEVFTPLDFEEKRNNYLGSAWSVQPTLFQSANFRPNNKSHEFENLYLVGASTHPGAGVPGVLLTAETTEKLIRKEYKLK